MRPFAVCLLLAFTLPFMQSNAWAQEVSLSSEQLNGNTVKATRMDTLRPCFSREKVRELDAGYDFIPAGKQFAVREMNASRVTILDQDFGCLACYFVGEDTVVHCDDPLVYTVAYKDYFAPDRCFHIPDSPWGKDLIGLVSDQRVFIMNKHGQIVKRMGYSVEVEARHELSARLRSPYRIAYLPKVNQLIVGVGPSDYFEVGDSASHFQSDSLFFVYRPAAHLLWEVLIAERYFFPHDAFYLNDGAYPHLDGVSISPSAKSKFFAVYQPHSLSLKVWNGQGKVVRDISTESIYTTLPKPHHFDRSLSKRQRSNEMALAHLQEEALGPVGFVRPPGYVYAVLKAAGDSAVAHKSLRDGWDYRAETLFLIRAGKRRASIKAKHPYPNHRILYYDQPNIIAVDQNGNLLRYRPLDGASSVEN